LALKNHQFSTEIIKLEILFNFISSNKMNQSIRSSAKILLLLIKFKINGNFIFENKMIQNTLSIMFIFKSIISQIYSFLGNIVCHLKQTRSFKIHLQVSKSSKEIMIGFINNQIFSRKYISVIKLKE
jgi:hypothetical protein